MAAYPDVGLRYTISPETRIKHSLSDAGTVRSVDMGDPTAYKIEITHPVVSLVDRAALRAFYDTYKFEVNTITLDGLDYEVTFLTDYAISNVGSRWFDMSATLNAVRL